MTLPTDERHPLKKQLFDLNIKIWWLAQATKINPSRLSLMLNCRVPMSAETEQKIQAVIDQVRADREQQQ